MTKHPCVTNCDSWLFRTAFSHNLLFIQGVSKVRSDLFSSNVSLFI